MVHVQIATEDLKTLHPGVTGLCFIIKVWLVTLIGLTNSLSTSNFSEMIKNVHVFMIKGVNQLLTCAFAWQDIQPTVLQLFLRYSFSRDLQCTNAPELTSLHKTQHKFT